LRTGPASAGPFSFDVLGVLRVSVGLPRAGLAQIRRAVGMGLATFGADNSLVVFGHLLQKSRKSCSTFLAGNVYFFFRWAHGVSV
jgi:hypothetical protein